MDEEDKRVMATRLEEIISYVKKLTNTQIDMMNQLMFEIQILNHKDVEITNFNSHNDILKNELKNERESMDKFNKTKEEMKYFKEIMKSACFYNGSRHSCTKKGEASTNG